MAELAPPVRVSPLIRACRWTAFGAGILWGMMRYSYLSKREVKIREYQARQKVILDAKKAEEKKISDRNELMYLAKETGTPIPPNF